MNGQPHTAEQKEPFICPRLLIAPPGPCYKRDGATIASAFILRNGDHIRQCTGCLTDTDTIDAS